MELGTELKGVVCRWYLRQRKTYGGKEWSLGERNNYRLGGQRGSSASERKVFSEALLESDNCQPSASGSLELAKGSVS